LLQIKNFKGDFKIAKILKYPNEVRLKLISEIVILQHVYYIWYFNDDFSLHWL